MFHDLQIFEILTSFRVDFKGIACLEWNAHDLIDLIVGDYSSEFVENYRWHCQRPLPGPAVH